MRLAFLIYKYFPYGGLQRDMRRFAEEIIKRGHDCRIYFIYWQGEPVAGADLRQVPASALSKHRRNQRFLQWVQADMAEDPVDGVVGFNKMPGLDVYYAGDPCYLEKALQILQQGTDSASPEALVDGLISWDRWSRVLFFVCYQLSGFTRENRFVTVPHVLEIHTDRAVSRIKG